MSLRAVSRYHDGTKHHFDRFARSLGYLDWASQPDPFRAYAGSRVFPLHQTASALDDLLRHSLGLSAWKSFRGSRWPLRVNPSSGNLHPTEAYVIAGAGTDAPGGPGVYHYASDRHALEQRCAFGGQPPRGLLIALTSIHWREAWKYGERAFRYCQHDIGHAIAAVRFAALLRGAQAALVAAASDDDVAALTGIDRDTDFIEAEREAPACLIAIGGQPDVAAFVSAARAAEWTGRANQLSEDHVQWAFIDEVAAATVNPGHDPRAVARSVRSASGDRTVRSPAGRSTPVAAARFPREILLQRRSALAFDGRTPTDAATFTRILAHTMPECGAPFDALWWTPRVHLALFVHRVTGIDAGVYLLVRDEGVLDDLKQACQADFAWQPASDELPLFLLARGDCRRAAQRLSCDQDIAADGFFSLGMIAEFDRSLEELGPSFYRNLFWESGVIGQALYLAAEAAGSRGTGIGCFYDDPVHERLGIRDHAFQSLYHFTIGMPVDDTRLTTEPGYAWEREA